MAERTMPAWRKRVVTAVVLSFLAIHFSYYVTGDHHWPFSGYPMYSYTIGKRVGENRVAFGCPVVYGVPADPEKPDFLLKPPQAGMIHGNRFAIGKLLRYPHRSAAYERLVEGCPTTSAERRACASQRLVDAALAHVIERYDARKARAKPGSRIPFPPLRGVRLYDVQYELELGTSKFEVAKKDLIQERMR